MATALDQLDILFSNNDNSIEQTLRQFINDLPRSSKEKKLYFRGVLDTQIKNLTSRQQRVDGVKLELENFVAKQPIIKCNAASFSLQSITTKMLDLWTTNPSGAINLSNNLKPKGSDLQNFCED